MQETSHHAQSLAIVRVETELRPDRVRARIQMHPQRKGDWFFATRLRGDFAQQQQLVEIIDLDHRTFLRGALQDRAALQRPVKIMSRPGMPFCRALSYSNSETTSAIAPSS